MADGSKTIDVIALVVSILALMGSVASPFITYNLLQNDVRIQRIKANAIRATGDFYARPRGPRVNDSITCNVNIVNDCDLPVGKVEAIIEGAGIGDRSIEEPAVVVEPPRKVTTQPSRARIIISFDEPLPPHENVSLTLIQRNPENTEEVHPRAWIRSESSAAVPVPLVNHTVAKQQQ